MSIATVRRSPGPLMAVGFVASSGEFPDPVTLAVWLVQVPVVVATRARRGRSGPVAGRPRRGAGRRP